MDTIYQFNPGYNRWSTDPGRAAFSLVLPVDVSGTRLPKHWQRCARSSERVRWQRHKVKSGEAISQIAASLQHDNRNDKAQRTTCEATRSVPGDHLMIPMATKPLECLQPECGCAPCQERRTGTRAGNKIEHIVDERRIVLDDFSRRYARSRHASSLPGMEWRHATRCPIGKKLVVWTNSRSLKRRACHRGRCWATQHDKLSYTVRNGDSLYIIARKFRVGIDQIARWNGYRSRTRS